MATGQQITSTAKTGRVVLRETIATGSLAADLWPSVSDTDRLNRAIGTKAVDFIANDRAASAARFVGRTRVAGLLLEYEEFPFEWTQDERLSVVRRMRRGPIDEYRYTLELRPRGNGTPGTDILVTLDLAPRSILWMPLIQLLGRAFLGGIVAYLKTADRAVAEKRALRPEPPTQVDTLRIRTGVAALERDGVSPEIARALGDLLQNGADVEVTRIRPFERADEWNEDRMRVLGAMLEGVKHGLLELRWSIICPSCLVPSTTVQALEEITPPGHCQFCDISFGLDLDQAVEATFVPHASIRTLDPRPFCIGGPGRTPHVVAQHVCEAGETVRFTAPKAAGRYRIFARGGATSTLEVHENHGEGARGIALGEGALEPSHLSVRAGAELTVSNNTSEPRHLKLERLAFASAAATAYTISNVPEFRRFFSKELLKPKTPMKVSRVTLLFSDLTGSTALYSTVGDAAAFRFVDDHFDVVQGALEPNGGVLVKTMGDAVMASFLEPSAGVRACHAALLAFDTFRKSTAHADLVGLKLGLYTGPCYVITANDKLDYFGQTVNLAARLQALADSGELVMEAAEYEALPASEQGLFRVVERFDKVVKGIAAPIHVLRLLPV